MKVIFSGLLLFLYLGNSFTSSAQPSWEVGIFGGASGYMGDLNPLNPIKLTDPAFGGFAKRNFDGNWALKFGITHGKIRENDAYSNNAQLNYRNLSFFTPLTELSFQTEFNFFNYVPGTDARRISPYLFAGLGMVNFSPKAHYNGEVYDLDLYGTEGQDLSNPYKKIALSFPLGAGVKYNITGNITLGAEIGYRRAYTDYLDDVSGKYASAAQLQFQNSPSQTIIRQNLADRSPQKNPAGSQRGDYRKYDTYIFSGLTLSYSIFSQKCPVAE